MNKWTLLRSGFAWGLLSCALGKADAATPVAPPHTATIPMTSALPAPRAVTLAEALAYARAHQPAVLAAVARITEAKANADIPRAEYYPVVAGTAQFLEGTANNTTASYVGAALIDLPRIGGTAFTPSASAAKLRPHPSTLAAIGAGQEIFDFGRIAAASAAADAAVVVATHASDTTRLDVDLGVEEAFFAVQAAKAILKASEDAYQRSSVHRDFAKAGVKSGLRSPIELTRAEADLSRFDTGRIRARGGVSVAQAVLAAAVGAPDPTLDAKEEPIPRTDLPSLSAAIERATAKDPRLQEAVSRLRAQELETRAVGALMRPDLQLSASISARAGGAPPNAAGESASGGGYLPEVPNWDAVVVLSWPLLDPTVTARERSSRSAEEVRRAEVELSRQQLVANVEQAHVGVAVAREALPSLERELEAARANYAQADARFRGGLGTSVELADAEALRTDAEIRLAVGIFEVARARAAFGRAIAEGL